MATTGGNAVISASPKLHPFLHQWMQCQPGHALFQIPHLIPLEQELQKHGYHLTETYHMFLPTSQALDIPPRQDCSAVWLTQEELLPFYGSPSFPNAICPECTPNRPDVLAVCAYHERSLWEWLAVPKTWQAGCKSALMFFRNIAPKDWELTWSRCCATAFCRIFMRFHFMEPVLQTTILGTSPFAADSDRHGWKSVPKGQIHKNPFSI